MIKLKQVKTASGIAEGIPSGQNGTWLFRGIPYAAPPVGELRWKPPVPAEPWEGVRRCNTWGDACMQNAFWKPGMFFSEEAYYVDYPPKMSEDCLYLNVWTPAKEGDAPMPVMVWLHGGGCATGYGHEMLFDGNAIARRNVILVTVNYRLNIFGYFAHPELTAESEHHASGNYGVMDQIAAIRWVHENIAGFGGDPSRITVFGQSGGARSTQAIACSPLTKDLVKRVIIHSGGGMVTGAGPQPREVVEQRGVKFMEYAGCKNIAEMRAIPAQELEDLYTKYTTGMSIEESMTKTFNIMTDGYVLPLSMEDTMRFGKENDFDYMFGCTADEGFTGSYKGPGKHSIAASQRAMANLMVEKGMTPYMYCFDRQMPGDDEGAYHSSDLWYVFGTLGRCWRPFVPEDFALSEKMTDYWTNFAKTGNPSGEGAEEWKPYGKEKLTMDLRLDGCRMEKYDRGGEMEQMEQAALAEFA